MGEWMIGMDRKWNAWENEMDDDEWMEMNGLMEMNALMEMNG